MALAAGTRLGACKSSPCSGVVAWVTSISRTTANSGRDVALKILPDTVTDDPDRVARFRREAHVLASLNHPHIAADLWFRGS